MKTFILFPALAASALLTACDARIGHRDEATNATGNASAEGKAEEGQLSVSAPGFEMKIDIPEGIRRQAGIDDDSGLIYPNGQFSGIHVEGGRDGPAGAGEGEVELRFTSADAPETIARWYRDPARSGDFSIGGAGREGQDFVITGTGKDDEGQFRVRLSPRAGGGTDGRLVLSDRH
jgi:hypothetical protein